MQASIHNRLNVGPIQVSILAVLYEMLMYAMDSTPAMERTLKS
jgi:hypothetical protein